MIERAILLTARAMSIQSTALNLFVETADALSRSEYGLPLEALVNELDTDRGRLRYGRLMGVMLKEPFADRFVRLLTGVGMSKRSKTPMLALDGNTWS
jgi:hypothetical protein